eukprot:CAMPEP_0194530030 /NCGR_PEP_ID=MMETSP0253-20130528/66863_1 /TAXON_ID=2966 /ORGANISM="Noctiluca scintillans" /LENGTH=173 /DNA_ID=CAMNT_0039375213 /DNA_START=254 /DNA_END=775 /DNA_ORIENTATION=-
MHLTFLPLTLKHASICEGKGAFTFSSIVDKLTSIRGPLRRSVHAVAIFFVVSVLSPEFCAVYPRLVAVTELHILLPLAIVPRTVNTEKFTFSVCLIVDPVSIVHVSVCMGELPFPVAPIVPELSVVLAAIRSRDNAVTMAGVPEPLAHVRTSVNLDLLPRSLEESRDPLRKPK